METSRIPVQSRARKTRAGLLAAGERLFASAGYEGATAKAIAAEAGVATGSFYQYFTDKDSLLHELARERSARLLAHGREAFAQVNERAELEMDSPAARAALRGVIEVVLKLHQDDRGLHAVLEQRRLTDPVLAEIMRGAERAYQEMLMMVLTQSGFAGDVEATAFTLLYMVEGVIHGHVLGQRVVSDARMLSALSDGVLAIAASGRGVQ